MAALEPFNTARAYVTYTVAEAEHTMMVRTTEDTSDGTLSEDIGAFIEAVEPLLYNSQFVKFERSDEGSNVRVPAVWSGPTEWGGSSGDPDEAPMFFSFTGKDVAGHKARVDIFGRGRAVGDGWRIFAVDDSSIANAITALQTTDAVFNSIGGAGVLWNAYANKSVAQHWVQERRG
jgi:hypothetical protein